MNPLLVLLPSYSGCRESGAFRHSVHPLVGLSACCFQHIEEAGLKGIPILQAQSYQRLDLGMEMAVTGRGMVLLLERGSFRALLPVGLDFETMEALDTGQVTAVLMAENGYAPLNTREWIEGLQPQVVLLSVAAGDRDGLPDPEALGATGGFNLLRTDQHGWIELATDGEQMWVEVKR